MNQNGNCKNKSDRLPLMDFPVAMAYVSWQEWKGNYDLEKGFEAGTIFPELCKPFTGCK